MAKYRNSFHSPMVRDSREWIETQANPQEYRGYLLYHRIQGVVWDVVKDDVCVGQYGGRQGARNYVDSLFDQGCRRCGYPVDSAGHMNGCGE